MGTNIHRMASPTLQARQAKFRASLQFLKLNQPIAVPPLAAETHSVLTWTLTALQ